MVKKKVEVLNSIETKPIVPINFIKIGQKDTGGVPIVERLNMMTVVDSLELGHLKRKCTSGFIIIISRDDGRFELHERLSNPCQGGHLRRYGPSHTNCTRPHDRMPPDLHNPFPNGRPVGLIYRLGYINNDFAKACFSNASPWVSGFGAARRADDLSKMVGEDNVVIDGQWMYIKSGNFDCTVLVNLLKAAGHSSTLYDKCLEAGLTKTEAMTFNMFFHEYNDGRGTNGYILSRNAYSFDPMNSVRRMIEQRPVNVTGGRFDEKGNLLELGSGLWGDGFDYNRPDMACVFRPDKSLDPEERLEKTFNVPKKFVEVKKGRQVISFEECLNIFNEAKEFEG